MPIVTSQKIIWTALPNGIRLSNGNEEKAELSIFVSPRLTISGTNDPKEKTLGKFHDFMDGQWIHKLNQTEFEIDFFYPDAPQQRIKTVPANEITKTSYSKLQPDLWTKLFKNNLPVDSHEVDNYRDGKYVPMSFNLTPISKYVEDRYSRILIKRRTVYPPIQELADVNTGFGHLNPNYILTADQIPVSDAKSKILEKIKENTINKIINSPGQAGGLGAGGAEWGVQASTDAESDTRHFLNLSLFYERNLPVKDILPEPEMSPTHYAEVLDFHKLLTALGSYPEILRRLGIIIDLSFPIPIPQSPDPITKKLMCLRLSIAPGNSENICPNTYIVSDGAKTFAVASDQYDKTRITDGMLAFNDTASYAISQIDVDGLGLKLMAFANELPVDKSGQVDMASAYTRTSSSIPYLQSGPIYVARSNKARDYVAPKMARYYDYETKLMNNVSFYAQDLMRGYRVDIWDSVSDKWHSLCKRSGTYSILDDNLAIIDSLIIDPDEGWVETGLTQTKKKKENSDEPEDDGTIYLNIHESLFKWQGWSMCAPRPGKPIDPDDQASSINNDPVTPIKFKTKFTPSELPRLRFGREYRARARVVDLAGNGLEFHDADYTHATPSGFRYFRFEPIASPAVILKSKLKYVSNGKEISSPGESLHHVVIRSRNIDEQHDTVVAPKEISERHIAPPKTSQILAETHGMFDVDGALSIDMYGMISTLDDKEINFYELTPSLKDGNGLDIPREQVLKEEHFPIDERVQSILPYMPDPMAVYACINGLPGKETFTKISFGEKQDWPYLKPFRIRLREPANNEDQGWQWIEEVANDPRVLEVRLAKASVINIQISCGMAPNDPSIGLQNMGIWDWIIKSLDVDKIKDAEKEALDGKIWLLTPSVNITMVHAVQQPLGHPEIKKLNVLLRQIGSTSVLLEGILNADIKSTNSVDVYAGWNDPLDDGKNPDPDKSKLTYNTKAFSIENISMRASPPNQLIINNVQLFGDTKHHYVKYNAISTTRFREYYFENSPITRESKVFPIHIPNAAQPAIPKIAYVVPSFKWESSSSDNNMKEIRKRSGSLRVYLERPWFTSGENELLGVVLWPYEIPRDSDLSKIPEKFITMWGSDPIWGSEALKNVSPALTDFTNRVEVGKVVLTEISRAMQVGVEVTIVGHSVEFDKDKNLWFCDIDIDPNNAYFPFVKLALVRYQPHSVTGCHISPVVCAEFAQISPIRTATLIRTLNNPNQFTVQITGVTYKNRIGHKKVEGNPNQDYAYEEELINGGSEIEVLVEKLDPSLGGDLGWEQVKEANIKPTNNNTSIPWSGVVTLPEHAESAKFRLVIKEYEVLETDSHDYGLDHRSKYTKISDEISNVRRLIYVNNWELL